MKFMNLTSQELIRQWRSRPAIAFQGFDASKFGFTKVEFYRWHVPLRREDAPRGGGDSPAAEQLALAIRTTTTNGERWFELQSPESQSDDALYMQPSSKSAPNNDQSEESRQAGSVPAADEMNNWLELTLATPEAKLPLFLLSYGYSDTGMYQVNDLKRHFLLDIRTGAPLIIKGVTCDQLEIFSGAGSAVDEASETPTNLQCDWEANSNDFHCNESVPYGNSHAARAATREFYLLSNRAVEPPAGNLVPDLEQLVSRIDRNPKGPIKGVLVGGLGPTTLLQRFDGLLPDARIFVFASPGAGQLLNAHLSIVIAANGKTTVQPIPKWGIGGLATDEEQGPEGYMLSDADDLYRSKLLEERPGFRAFQTVLTARPTNNPVHVVYWVGLEAVDGKITANAVRLAGEDYAYEGYGSYFHESTATSVRQKAGTAEATARVQGPFDYEQTNSYPTEEGNCVWDGLLHWKSGSGFRVRKLAEDCKAPHREVKIADDGSLQSLPAQNAPAP